MPLFRVPPCPNIAGMRLPVLIHVITLLICFAAASADALAGSADAEDPGGCQRVTSGIEEVSPSEPTGVGGLAAFVNGKFTAVPSVPAGTTFAIAGDNHGGLWLSRWFTAADDGLAHLLEGKIIEQAPWQKLGGGPGTGGLVPDPDGGVWAGLFSGGLAYFRQGQIRNLPLRDESGAASVVLDLSRNRDGTFWAATENGLSRISNGHVATLTTANGLPCNKVHWIIEDDASSYWLYTQCGLLRVARAELDAWVADPKRTIQVTTFDDADGIRLASNPQRDAPSGSKIVRRENLVRQL